MATGKVVRLVRDRGFGFIKPDEDGAPDIFFHISGVRPSRGFSFHLLQEGQPVNYTIGQGEKGPRAEDIVDATASPDDLTDRHSGDYDEARDSDRRPARRR